MTEQTTRTKRVRTLRFRPYKDGKYISKYPPSTELGLISETKPNILNRFFDGPQNLDDSAMVQFGQDALNECIQRDPTWTMYPRLTLNYYNQGGEAFNDALNNLYELGQKFTPKQTAIALDNENVIANFTEALDAIGMCRAAGFTGVCFGALGSRFQGQWKDGDVDIVMLGVNTNTWECDPALVKYWQQFKSVKRIIFQIDPPDEMLKFTALTYDEKLAALNHLFLQQDLVNAAFMPLIEQEQFDSLLEGTFFDILAQMEAYN